MAEDKPNMGDAAQAPPSAPEVVEKAPKPEPTPRKAMRNDISKPGPEPPTTADSGTKTSPMKDFWLCMGILILFLTVCALGTIVIAVMGVKDKDFSINNRIKGYHGVVNRVE